MPGLAEEVSDVEPAQRAGRRPIHVHTLASMRHQIGRDLHGSDEQQVRQAVVVPVGGAEPVLGPDGAAKEEVQVVLPRVPDATVDLGRILRTAWTRRRPPPPSRRGTARSRSRVGGVDGHRRVVHALRSRARRRATCRRGGAGSPGTTRSARRTGSAPSRRRASCRRAGGRCRPSRPRARPSRARAARRARPGPAARSAPSAEVSTSKSRREKSKVRDLRRREVGGARRRAPPVPARRRRRSSRRGRPRARTSSPARRSAPSRRRRPASATVPVVSPATTRSAAARVPIGGEQRREQRRGRRRRPRGRDVPDLLDEQARDRCTGRSPSAANSRELRPAAGRRRSGRRCAPRTSAGGHSLASSARAVSRSSTCPR